MKKNFFMSACVALLTVCFLCSCTEGISRTEMMSQSPESSEPETETFTYKVSRDGEMGTVDAWKGVNGVREDTTIVVPLGTYKINISVPDTIAVQDTIVSRTEFVQIGEDSVVYEEDVERHIFYTTTYKKYRDVLSKYTKDIVVSFKDASIMLWGEKIELPKANVEVAFNGEPLVKDGGNCGKNRLYSVETIYDVSFIGLKRQEKGYQFLSQETEDLLVSSTKTGEGYETQTATTAKSWVEITRVYRVSGEKKSRYEVILHNGIVAPTYDIKDVVNFDLAKQEATLEAATKVSEKNEANIKVASYSQNYVVGNNIFDLTFVLNYDKAVLNVDGKTYDMPSRKYENLSNEFNLSEMEDLIGYDRMLYTHVMNAKFNNNDATAKAEVELRVVEEIDEIVEPAIVIEEGVDYINETTSKSWIKIREVWSLSGVKEYIKSVNLTNKISSPAKGQKIISNFDLTQKSAVLGSSKLVDTKKVGDFTVKTYEVTYTVGNNEFTRTFVLSYQVAVFNPMSHQMPYAQFEEVKDKGFVYQDLSNTSSNGQDYYRKNYAHTMRATFLNHNVQATAEVELWVAKPEPKEHWLGTLVEFLHSRVQKKPGARFEDMRVAHFEHGVIIFPEGVDDIKGENIFAFDPACAAARGVAQCIEGAFSGVWGEGKWQPAKITEVNGLWIYTGLDPSWDHSVFETDAVVLGIGEEVTPIPTHQRWEEKSGTFSLYYHKGNKEKKESVLSFKL